MLFTGKFFNTAIATLVPPGRKVVLSMGLTAWQV